MPGRSAAGGEFAQATDPPGGSGFSHQADQHAAGQTSQDVTFLGAEWRHDIAEQVQPRCLDLPGQPPSHRGERDGRTAPIRPRTPADPAVPLQSVNQSDPPGLGQTDHLGQLVHRRTVEELSSADNAAAAVSDRPSSASTDSTIRSDVASINAPSTLAAWPDGAGVIEGG